MSFYTGAGSNCFLEFLQEENKVKTENRTFCSKRMYIKRIIILLYFRNFFM